MQLKELLADETFRANTNFVLDIIRQKPELLDKLTEIIFSKEQPYARRAIWVLDIYDERYPEQTNAFLIRIIENLSLEDHDALKRHSLRILSKHPIPEKDKIHIFDFCLQILTGNEAPAPKVFAMEIMNKIAMSEPGLIHEVILAIELATTEGSAGVKNRGKKILRKLNKLVN